MKKTITFKAIDIAKEIKYRSHKHEDTYIAIYGLPDGTITSSRPDGPSTVLAETADQEFDWCLSNYANRTAEAIVEAEGLKDLTFEIEEVTMYVFKQ